jgi:hypothetical protein
MYIEVSTESKISLVAIKQKHVDISFPRTPSDEYLSSLGYEPLHYDPRPAADVVTEGAIEQRGDGKWYQTWDSRTWTQTELDQQLANKRAGMRVTKRQGRQQMIILGVIGDVEAAIAAIPDSMQRLLVQSFWEDSSEYERTHPQMIQLAQAIGMTDTDLDQAFEAAALL